MLAGARYGTQAIPPRWQNSLPTEIRKHCETQAQALLALPR